MELLERFVIAAERIADAMEGEIVDDEPDALPSTYMDGTPVQQ